MIFKFYRNKNICIILTNLKSRIIINDFVIKNIFNLYID